MLVRAFLITSTDTMFNIKKSLEGLGFDGVNDVRQGKFIEIELTDGDKVAAEAKVAEMCEQLLANTVIEDFSVEIDG